jgi:uncharacterized protein YifE (UPF0438 family)
MSEDVFSSQTVDNTTPVNQLDELVGPGKKFETVEALAKGKLEADLHIKRLEGEAQLTREQLTDLQQKAEKNVTLSGILDQFKKAQQDSEEGKTTPVTEESLKDLVKQVMNGETEAQTRAQNHRAANEAVLHKLNGNVEAARAYVAEKAKAHGMTVEQVQALGESSPSAFRNIMGIDQQVPAQRGQQGVSSLASYQPPTGATEVVDGHKTKGYYDRLKKEMGVAAYWNDSKLQKQYFADAFALQERFK